jgi:hypothetical protein
VDRTQLQNWVNGLWEEKDAEIDQIKAQPTSAAALKG